ncbi:hypothetical protein TNCV_1721691 [Trichonephila clavipes]|nr:hypothetical protein TNCV_1721691 [Trichonephila clavipes]
MHLAMGNKYICQRLLCQLCALSFGLKCRPSEPRPPTTLDKLEFVPVIGSMIIDGRPQSIKGGCPVNTFDFKCCPLSGRVMAKSMSASMAEIDFWFQIGGQQPDMIYDGYRDRFGMKGP